MKNTKITNVLCQEIINVINVKKFTYKQKKNLYAHIRAIHEETKVHECDKCCKSFSRAKALRDHISRHCS